MTREILLSIVVPVYNEADGIEEFHTRLLLPNLSETTKGSYEIIYINDGSSDRTLDILQTIAHENEHIKVISLSRNFGKEVATSAGLKFASGQATIIMDADGQHPPALIPDFLAKWRAGAQVITGIRQENSREGFVKKWGSKLFYRLFNFISGVTITPGSTDYRLLDRAVRNEFIKLTEHNRITRGLIDWLGFRRDYIVFSAPPRLAGTPTYSPRKLVKLAMNSFISLSLRPLFMLGWVGLIITILSFCTGVLIFIEQFILADPLRLHFTGPALLGIFISFLVGLVIMSQGVLAVYLSHIHTHAQGRPLFIVDYSESIGIK